MSVQTHVSIAICSSVADAIKRGFFYRKPVYNPISITQIVVVQNGTVGDKPTVDIILEDEHGKKFVVMLTGAMIKAIPC